MDRLHEGLWLKVIDLVQGAAADVGFQVGWASTDSEQGVVADVGFPVGWASRDSEQGVVADVVIRVGLASTDGCLAVAIRSTRPDHPNPSRAAN